MTFEPLKYSEPNANDEVRAQEAEQFYRSNVVCQVFAELYRYLAADPPDWYPAEEQITDWPINKRLQELAERPDVRYKIMCVGFADGMPEKTTRNMPPASQADWLDQARNSGDKTAAQHVRMFNYSLSMCHTDPVTRFLQLSKRIDWNSDQTRDFLQILLTSSLNAERYYDNGVPLVHPPVITHHDLLSALDPIEYLKSVGLEGQIKILARRLEAEKQGGSFTAKDELEEVMPIRVLCFAMPIPCFKPVFDLIGEKLGFITPVTEVPEPETTDDEGESQIVGELPDSSPVSLPAVLQVTDVVTANGDKSPKA